MFFISRDYLLYLLFCVCGMWWRPVRGGFTTERGKAHTDPEYTSTARIVIIKTKSASKISNDFIK